MKATCVALGLAALIGGAGPAWGAEIVREVYSPLGLPAAGYVYQPETYYVPLAPTYYEGAYEYGASRVTYYAPPYETAYVAPPPVATYYAPSYSAAYRTYYAPSEVYYAPSNVSPTDTYYYSPAVPAYVPGRPVRNFFRALVR